jgi:hypothetical protein
METTRFHCFQQDLELVIAFHSILSRSPFFMMMMMVGLVSVAMAFERVF